MSSKEASPSPPPVRPTRKRKATEKQQAVDEENFEDAKKKIKSLETRVGELAGMNDDLRSYVRANLGGHKGQGTSADTEAVNIASPTIFTAKKVIRKEKAKATPSNKIQQSSKGSTVTTHPDPHPSNGGDPQPSAAGATPQPTPNPEEVRPLIDGPPRPWPPAPFAPGVDHKKAKTANKDYDDIVARMLSTAEHDFESQISTEDPYPDLSTQIRWSIECWEGVCKEEDHYWELSNDMRNLIKGRCSHARGAALTQIRPIIDSLFDSSRTSNVVKKANESTHKRLLEANAFYYKDTLHRTDQFKNEKLRECIRKAFFCGDKSELVRYKDKFNPIPLPSIALIEHCIREWSTGVQKRVPLDEARDRARYKTHIENVKKWAALKPETTTNIRKQMFKRFITIRGIGSEDPEASKGLVSEDALVAEREALEGQTGLTDSEPEDEY